MSRARLMLHVLALGASVLVTLLRGFFPLPNRTGVGAGVAVSAVVATQLACLIYWPWIERRAKRAAAGWPTGFVIAAASHVLCTIGIVLPNLSGSGFPSGILAIGTIVLGFSLLVVGWMSFPLSMLMTHWVVRLRTQELQHV